MTQPNQSKPRVKCDECGGSVWRYGTIPSRAGVQQRYKCTKCAHVFTRFLKKG